MPTVDDAIFPEEIGFNSRGGPRYRTKITSLSAGRDKRDQRWAQPLEEWDVAYGVKSEEDLEDLVDFFHARRAMARAFKFKHPYRNTVLATTMSWITSKTFQIVKVYGSGTNALTRTIRCPHTDLVIRRGGNPITSGWTVDYSTGIVTFTNAPGNPQPTAECTFFFPMRFATDKLEVSYVEYELGEASVPIIEVR